MPLGLTPFGAPGSGATSIQNSSGNQANANAVATLTAPAGVTAWISGFECNSAGATAGLAVSVTVTGLLGGTKTYAFTHATGVTVGSQLIVQFSPPLPASAANTNIVVTLPASGAGGTNATCNAEGFLL